MAPLKQVPTVSLFDIFLPGGRTIRRPKASGHHSRSASTATKGERSDSERAPNTGNRGNESDGKAKKRPNVAKPRNGTDTGPVRGEKKASKKGKERATAATVKRVEYKTLDEDENLSVDDLQELADIVRKDQQQMWLRIASVFYDRTGTRIDPGLVEEKFT